MKRYSAVRARPGIAAIGNADADDRLIGEAAPVLLEWMLPAPKLVPYTRKFCRLAH